MLSLKISFSELTFEIRVLRSFELFHDLDFFHKVLNLVHFGLSSVVKWLVHNMQTQLNFFSIVENGLHLICDIRVYLIGFGVLFSFSLFRYF